MRELPPIFLRFSSPLMLEIETLKSFSVQWHVSSLIKLCKQHVAILTVTMSSGVIDNLRSKILNFRANIPNEFSIVFLARLNL